jgi:hypothetical protein
MTMSGRFLIAVAMLGLMPAADALAQRVPSTAMPGRERQQLLDPFSPFQPPRIELQDGKPRKVIRTPKQSRPAKRKRQR